MLFTEKVVLAKQAKNSTCENKVVFLKIIIIVIIIIVVINHICAGYLLLHSCNKLCL